MEKNNTTYAQLKTMSRNRYKGEGYRFILTDNAKRLIYTQELIHNYKGSQPENSHEQSPMCS